MLWGQSFCSNIFYCLEIAITVNSVLKDLSPQQMDQEKYPTSDYANVVRFAYLIVQEVVAISRILSADIAITASCLLVISLEAACTLTAIAYSRHSQIRIN